MKLVILALVALVATASAQPVPSGGLHKVTHDATLTGAGTLASALGLAPCGSAGQTWVWNGTTFTCGSAGGTVTNVDTLAPLQGGPINMTGTVSLINCPANDIYKMDGTGTSWACAADADTTYSAGTGIALGGTTFSLATIATARLFGNVSGSTAAPSAITGTQATTLLDTFTATLKGLVPAPGTATGTKYLRDDGTFATPPDTGITGTITSGDLIAATGTGTVGNFAGSTPSACTAGNVTTGVSIGANGALTNTCTAIGTQGGTTGTGTTDRVAKWSSTTGLSAGWPTDDGTTWGVPGKFTLDEATGNANASGAVTAAGAITGLTLGEAISAAESWIWVTKTTPVTFPVPTIQPTQANTVIAVDVMPKGTPTIGTGGYAWEDVCDADLIANNLAPVHCARLGMGSNPAFDSVALNGATAQPLSFRMNGTEVLSVASSLVTSAQPIAINMGSWVNKVLAITDSGAGGSVVQVDNTSATTSAFSAYTATNDASTGAATLYAFGTGWTTNGGLMQDGAALYSGAGLSNGLSLIASATTGQVRTYAGGVAASNLVETVTPKGHINIGGTTSPSLSAGCTSGTGSAIIGTDTDFAFTTGSTSTACTVTFANTYTSKPIGECFPEGTPTLPTCTWSATALTCSTNASGITYNCHVKGQNGGT